MTPRSVDGVNRTVAQREILSCPAKHTFVTENQSETHPRTVPVDPPVYLELFPTHLTATWTASGPSAFVEAVCTLKSVPLSASTVVDGPEIAGRKRVPLSAVTPNKNSLTYLRVEPDASWTLSWEDRTRPVVSASGAPPATLCRRLHIATTDCAAWDDAAFDIMCRVASETQH